MYLDVFPQKHKFHQKLCSIIDFVKHMPIHLLHHGC
uniref:Uncharacterized protein n=1 Tax=Anguilla anguilla TaxID=7936 RepID=A0A0E9P8M2_ANGAN